MLAGQAVSEFVQGHDEKRDQQKNGNGGELIEPRKVTEILAPICGGHEHGEENDRGRKDDERAGEEKLNMRNEAIEKPVWIKGAKPEIQRIASDALRRAGGSLVLGAFKQTVLFQGVDKGVEGFQGKGPIELFFGSLANRLQGSFAVELARDEVFSFTEAEEVAGDRILDDKERRGTGLLFADGQVSAE